MANRIYDQGVASIAGATGGINLRFVLNPSDVRWNFTVNTSVTETLGGRVIQVLGANLSDMTISGVLSNQTMPGKEPWEIAENFLTQVENLVQYQSSDVNTQGKMAQSSLIFSFPPKNWKFEGYIKNLTDEQGGPFINHTPEKYVYRYVITFSILNDLNNTSRIIGNTSGQLNINADKVISSYINSIANGIQWKVSGYNGPEAVEHSLADKISGTPGDGDSDGYQYITDQTDVVNSSGGGSSSSAGDSSGGGSAKDVKGSGGKLSSDQIKKYASDAGFSGEDLQIAVAVAEAESGGDPNAVNHNTNGTDDKGLWQINDVNSDVINACGGNRFDPAQNAKMAKKIHDRQGWEGWSTYTSGAYKQYMN